MAGFDFHVPKHATGETLQRGLLRLTQSEARDLGLQFRYRSEGGDFWGEFDGPLTLMYALQASLEDDFPTYVAAASAPPDRQQRRRIARALLCAFDEGLQRITDAIHKEIAPALGGVPNSVVFDDGSTSHLAHLLRSLTRTLILDMQGRVSRQTAVEETHTVLENLLRPLLGRTARNWSFAEMVDEAALRGHLSEMEARDVKRLKDVRREAKHRGQQPDEAETGRLLSVSITVIQKLLARIRAT